jgi:hypothetical protein
LKNGLGVLLVIGMLVPSICSGVQKDGCGEEISLHTLGSWGFSQEYAKFGKFGKVVVEMARVQPPDDAFLSAIIAVKSLSGRQLRTVKMDFLEIRGQNYLVRMLVDGRENHFEYSAAEGRVLNWWGPDKRPLVFEKGAIVTPCELTGIWTCAVQGGLWGLVNPLAGATAAIICGIGFAAACN